MIFSTFAHVFSQPERSFPLSSQVPGPDSNVGRGSLHTNERFSGYQMGVQQFNSILTLNIQRRRQIPQLTGSVLQDLSQSCPPPANLRCQSPAQIVICASDKPAIQWRFQQPPPWIQMSVTGPGCHRDPSPTGSKPKVPRYAPWV